MAEAPSDDALYAVVINGEERYSIWRADREPPAGWARTGFAGAREACLAHIDEVWTDMRPKSLRERMAQSGDDA
jgi:MbtH protein